MRIEGEAEMEPGFSMGVEEFANIRFQSNIRDRAVFYGAVNLFALTGNYAENRSSFGYYSMGYNFVSGIELERLYFRINGEYTDLDAGLMRMPFGYGQVWGPSDFLNPRNPLKPDARPLAVIGAGLSWYPADDFKLFGFYSAPRDVFTKGAEGSFIGLSMDKHWEKASVQLLYSFETPDEFGIHHAGLSVKADVEIGLVMDILYSYDHQLTKDYDFSFQDGLSFSVGADYSFFGGKLIALAEYLYSGKFSITSYGSIGYYRNRNYLYTGLTWCFSDYTNINAAVIFGFDDSSFIPTLTFNHELFQGATLTLTAQMPLDRAVLYNEAGNPGDFGPLIPGVLEDGYRYFTLSTRLRLRF
jgi:hypothetical protein